MKNTQYLVQVGGRWYCRVRWPKEIWGALGDGSFKRSLRTDSRSEALLRLPGALQEFQNAVAVAKARQLEAAPRPLGAGEITLLVARWYEAAQGAFEPNPRPQQRDAVEREERRRFIETQEEGLVRKRRQLGEADYSTLYPLVDGLLSRTGLNVDREDASFGLLCQTLMRAWIALEETALAKMRGEFGHRPADPILQELEAAEPSVAAAPTSRTLDGLIGAYEADNAARWSQSTVNAYRPVFRVLRDTLGANREVRSVDREAAREVFEVVKGLPRNLGKNRELAALPVPAAVAAAQSLGLPTISPKSINDSYMALSVALFGWGLRERWTEYNPFVGLRVVEAVAPQDKRDAFTPDQLAAVFGGAPWSTGDTAPGGKPSLYWAPLLSLYHGLRIGEPCGLLTEEIVERDGVAAIDVKPNDLRRLKNRHTKRFLPIHPELIRLGFLDYVEARRRAGDRQLFPEARQDANGHYGDHVTDWFRRLLEARGLRGQGVNSGNLTLHSLRHSFQDALRDAGIEETLEGKVLAGRQRGADPVAAAYGNGRNMEQLAAQLGKVAYPAVGIPVAGGVEAAA
ncbi:MAG: site-specific integrase [Phenylobacterium sp.]|uniref:site-specific integrase n=1 Tax=Phenylobacterium sp. TaxID=1871053 RepID=UPI001A3FDD3B|nr:site-specific integrase [Phenylobacterium sp.]MBL8554026.1 site-specific integrase [Phenylobacterium sp.]